MMGTVGGGGEKVQKLAGRRRPGRPAAPAGARELGSESPVPAGRSPHPRARTPATMTQALTQDQVQQLRKEFEADPRNRLMQNAVTHTTIDEVALDRAIVTGIDHSVSHLLDDWKVTNQKKSGRCWLFAGLNLLRVGAPRKIGPQGLRVLPEPPAVLGQARAGQLLPRGDHRDRRPRRRRPHRRLPADRPDRRRRPVEHVRRPGPQARPGAQGRPCRRPTALRDPGR